MKIKLITYLLSIFCSGLASSQELRMMPRDINEPNSYLIKFDAEDSNEQKNSNLFQFGNDLYNLQIANFEIGSILFEFNSRLEEELPYNYNSYNYSGFYYLDLGVSYMISNFGLRLSIENFLNSDNKNFSIDPISEQSNGIINSYYFSHESDTLISMSITYDF